MTENVPIPGDIFKLLSMAMEQMQCGEAIALSYTDRWFEFSQGLVDDCDKFPLAMGCVVPLGTAFQALPGNKGAFYFGIDNRFMPSMIAHMPQLKVGFKY